MNDRREWILLGATVVATAVVLWLIPMPAESRPILLLYWGGGLASLRWVWCYPIQAGPEQNALPMEQPTLAAICVLSVSAVAITAEGLGYGVFLWTGTTYDYWFAWLLPRVLGFSVAALAAARTLLAAQRAGITMKWLVRHYQHAAIVGAVAAAVATVLLWWAVPESPATAGRVHRLEHRSTWLLTISVGAAAFAIRVLPGTIWTLPQARDAIRIATAAGLYFSAPLVEVLFAGRPKLQNIASDAPRLITYLLVPATGLALAVAVGIAAGRRVFDEYHTERDGIEPEPGNKNGGGDGVALGDATGLPSTAKTPTNSIPAASDQRPSHRWSMPAVLAALIGITITVVAVADSSIPASLKLRTAGVAVTCCALVRPPTRVPFRATGVGLGGAVALAPHVSFTFSGDDGDRLALLLTGKSGTAEILAITSVALLVVGFVILLVRPGSTPPLLVALEDERGFDRERAAAPPWRFAACCAAIAATIVIMLLAIATDRNMILRGVRAGGLHNQMSFVAPVLLVGIPMFAVGIARLPASWVEARHRTRARIAAAGGMLYGLGVVLHGRPQGTAGFLAEHGAPGTLGILCLALFVRSFARRPAS